MSTSSYCAEDSKREVCFWQDKLEEAYVSSDSKQLPKYSTPKKSKRSKRKRVGWLHWVVCNLYSVLYISWNYIIVRVIAAIKCLNCFSLLCCEAVHLSLPFHVIWAHHIFVTNNLVQYEIRIKSNNILIWPLVWFHA